MSKLKRLVALALLATALTGCSSYSSPRYGDDGVYGSGGFDSAVLAQSRNAYSALYPYWSLDHFYFSQFYSPFSVIVHPWDPWLFPYSAWYWNYPYAHGRFFVGGPWFYSAPWSLQYHRPWHHRRQGYRYGSYYDHYQDQPYSSFDNNRGRRMTAGSGDQRSSGGQQIRRLEQLEQRRTRSSGGDSSPQRQRPVTRQRTRAPASRRSPVRATQPSRLPSRAPERIKEQPPW